VKREARDCARRATRLGPLVFPVLLVLAGCATLAAPPAIPKTTPAVAAWRALVQGDHRTAEAAFETALRQQPGDAPALFGVAALAWERGDDARALEASFALLELIASGRAGAWGPVLATAAASRLPSLLGSVVDRRAAEDRLLRLPRERLPWQAQLALAEAFDAVARRRGDPALLAAEPTRAGCVVEAALLGVAGRLPHLDLSAPFVLPPGASPHRVDASGCRLTLPALEGHPGVRVLRARRDANAAEHLLVLDFPGPALVRVNGGPWHAHGSDAVYGPRWSAFPTRLEAGSHSIEVRLGTYGGSAELRLFLLPAPPHKVTIPEEAGSDPALTALAVLADAWVADVAGEGDRALGLASRLGQERRFALGLATAGALAGRDPSRPGTMARDLRRSLFRRAVAMDDRFARLWRELAEDELLRERAAEAVEAAERAVRAAPGWWPAQATLIEALRARGLERNADRALDEALAGLGRGDSACPIRQMGYERARQRHRVKEEATLAEDLVRCDAESSVMVDRLRLRGDLEAAQAALEGLLRFGRDRLWLEGDLAAVKLARGDAPGAVRALEHLVALAPRDTSFRMRLGDAWLAAGDPARARRVIAETLRRFPGRSEVRQAARVLGLPMPIDPFRVDGGSVVRAFKASARAYEAPAVLVLDRTSARVLEDGTQIILTHNIVRVQTKDGIARWGEVHVPEGAEILALRTHKADGSVREPEDIAGKPTISAPDLSVGDFVEWETVEYREPAEAFAPGFLGDRFYFQSLELPLHLSEYLVILPKTMPLDSDPRAGAPTPKVESGPEGTRVLRFVAKEMPQLFAERAAVPAIDWVPSVRVSSGVTKERWARYVAEQLYGVSRTSPALKDVARRIETEVKGDRTLLPAAIVRWVTETIEPEAALTEPATATLARGRGNRPGLIVALARALGVRADVVLARSPLTAAAGAPVVAQELDDFGQVLVRFSGAGPKAASRFVDPHLKRAPFGYLPPALDGALCMELGTGALHRASTAVADARSVQVDLRLSDDGSAQGRATERLSGWPAIEWAQILERAGEDEDKLRQDFEQRWLSQHFPGARLEDLAIEVVDGGARGARLRYGFSSPQFAIRSGTELKLVPTFFRSQPGRRYATLRSRRTALLLGADVSLDLEVRIDLPPGAQVTDAGPSGSILAGPKSEIRFVEQRQVRPSRPGGSSGPRLLLRRQVRMPLFRAPPERYETLAAQLRRIDPLEQAEIRVRTGTQSKAE
jgi:cellulose synthase operon protein C